VAEVDACEGDTGVRGVGCEGETVSMMGKSRSNTREGVQRPVPWQSQSTLPGTTQTLACHPSSHPHTLPIVSFNARLLSTLATDIITLASSPAMVPVPYAPDTPPDTPPFTYVTPYGPITISASSSTFPAISSASTSLSELSLKWTPEGVANVPPQDLLDCLSFLSLNNPFLNKLLLDHVYDH
jgi:hypothetical protein